MFHMSLHRKQPSAEVVEKVQEMDVDVKEQFLTHACRDLLNSYRISRRLAAANIPSLSGLKFAIGIPISISNELARKNASSDVGRTH